MEMISRIEAMRRAKEHEMLRTASIKDSQKSRIDLVTNEANLAQDFLCSICLDLV